MGGARVVARDPGGREVATDVPAALGGENTDVSPGWLVRAGIANCLATCIVLLAAKARIELDRLEVDVASRSDVRGILGIAGEDGAPVWPGPRDLEMTVRIASRAASAEQLRGLVDAARTVSPVQATIEQATPIGIRVEVG
jgi:uncharacterized OsmC-like protein